MSYNDTDLPLWPLLPNWKRGVAETLGFRTRIIGPTYTGLRQKRRMRIAPRRAFDFEVHPHHDGRRLLENIRFARGRQQWALPIWPDRQKLAVGPSIGASSITCGTAGYDFVDGGLAVLRGAGVYTTKFELIHIDTVGPTGLTLSENVEQAWGGLATHLYPVRAARLAEDSQNVVLLNGEVSTMSVSMEIAEPCDWEAHTFEETYRGRPVWRFKHNWKDQRSFAFNRITEVIDNDTSLPALFDFPNKVFAALNGSLVAKTREQSLLNRAVLYALAGRYTSVWVPTLADDLRVIATIGSAAVTVDIAYCGYTLFGLNKDGRRDIMIELRDGSVYYRRIADSVEVSGNEQITLNAALGVSVAPENILRVSFLMLMQQSSDSATITHLTDQSSTLPIALEGVVEPPSE